MKSKRQDEIHCRERDLNYLHRSWPWIHPLILIWKQNQSAVSRLSLLFIFLSRTSHPWRGRFRSGLWRDHLQLDGGGWCAWSGMRQSKVIKISKKKKRSLKKQKTLLLLLLPPRFISSCMFPAAAAAAAAGMAAASYSHLKWTGGRRDKRIKKLSNDSRHKRNVSFTRTQIIPSKKQTNRRKQKKSKVKRGGLKSNCCARSRCSWWPGAAGNIVK